MQVTQSSRYYGWLLLLLWLAGSIFPARGQGMTATDSASMWPSHLYVLVQDTPYAMHQVLARASAARFGSPDSARVEFFNLLVPAAKLPQVSAAVLAAHDTLLMSLAVLPDRRGGLCWQPIDVDTIPAGHLRTGEALAREGQQRLVAYYRAGRPREHLLLARENLFPIVRRQGRYWVPCGRVLTQYFRVHTQAVRTLAAVDYATLNVNSPRLDREAPWRTIHELLLTYPYSRSLPMGLVTEGASQDIYEFWSRISFNVTDGILRDYGAGILEYKPGIGLVSGRYAVNYSPLSYNPRLLFNYILVDGTWRLR